MPDHSPDVFFPAFFGVFFLIWLLVVVLALTATVFWIVELVDVARREFPDPNAKIIWLLVVILAHGIGALVYYFVGKPQGFLPGQGLPPAQPPYSQDTWPPRSGLGR